MSDEKDSPGDRTRQTVNRVPAKVITGGRVTIPAQIRHEKGLSVGDYVLINVEKLSGGILNGD